MKLEVPTSGHDVDLANIASLVDALVISQHAETIDNILSKLHGELKTRRENLYVSSSYNQMESCFIKLCTLLPTTSLSSYCSLMACCSIAVQVLVDLNRLTQSMERQPSKCDQYYTLAMDALNTQPNLDFLRGENKESDTDLHTDYLRTFLSFARETIRFQNRRREALNVRQWNSYQSCLESKYHPLIKSLLSFFDKKLTSQDDLSASLYFFVSLSDNTSLVPDLVQCGLADYAKTWLLLLNKTETFRSYNSLEVLLLIINNLSRHEDVCNLFKNAQMSQILSEFWDHYKEILSTDLIALYYMAYALIVSSDELKSATILHNVIDYLVSNVRIASQTSDMRSVSAHMSEYLVALARLIVNDNVAQYIIGSSKVDANLDDLIFFQELFFKYNDLTSNDLYLVHLSRIALFNIFSSFSYQTIAQPLLLNQKFVEIVKRAARDQTEQDSVIHPSLLQHLSSIKQATEAILINLDLYKDEDTTNASPSSSVTHPHVMISYSHKDVAFCRALVQALKSYSINLWVDEDGHCRSDDCWEEIAQAIKHASLVLVIVSASYCQSPSCRKEATYADKRKKSLIALYPNDNRYEPDEWLDIRLTGAYVRFGDSGKKSFDDCIVRLLDYIRSQGSEIAKASFPKQILVLPSAEETHSLTTSTSRSIEVVSSAPTGSLTKAKTSIHDWTREDVQRWFLIERQLLPELYQLYSFVDGDSLMEYGKYFLREHEDNAKQQYEKLQQRLRNKFGVELYDNNYTDLVCSMKKLLIVDDQRPLPTTMKTQQKGSSTCIIV